MGSTAEPSALAAGHKSLLPKLVEELKRRGHEDIMVICSGVIPAQDYDFLLTHGATAVFGPGTVIPTAAKTILTELNKRLGH
jgi:methylmalonyl-CoA mutase